MILKSKNTLKDVDLLNKYSAEEVLKWAAYSYEKRIAFSSAFGPECQVLLDMIQQHSIEIPIFTLDTGRLFNETYNLISKTEKLYEIKIKTYFPDSANVEKMVLHSGINLFYDSINLREKCCHTRKLQPLKRALEGIECWITGLRKEQSETRDNMKILEFDKERNLIKINPLINWSESQIWDYIRKNNVPYNILHDQGYQSIGCACCTRPVKPGDHPRSGRWWWEKPEHRECGLHIKNGKVMHHTVSSK